MFTTIIFKELKAIILSPKFTATFAVYSVLLLLSVYTGIAEYKSSVAKYETGVELADQQLRERNSWHSARYQTFRKPDPMTIFVSGLSNDIGRWSEVATDKSIKLRNSSYSEDPIFAVFRFLDFTFIVQVVFSLFAILFTFDSICGERENGMLKLIFSHAVPRAKYLIAKSIGSWLGLVIPVLIPILLAVLMVLVSNVPFEASHWVRFSGLLLMSILFLTFFIVLGVFISSLTKRSSVSFLIALVVWIGTVLIIPRTGVMAAGQIVHVPRVAEIEAQRDGFAKDLWRDFYDDMEERWADRRENEGEDEFDDDVMWSRMMEQDSLRREVELKIEEFEIILQNDLQQKKKTQQKLAFTMARFSPVSAYQLAAMSLGESDVELKDRYYDAMSDYRKEYNAYVDRKQSESGLTGGYVSITMDSEKGMKIGTGRDDQSIDVSDMPKFTPPEKEINSHIASIIPDSMILIIGIILAFLGSFISFLRYDVR